MQYINSRSFTKKTRENSNPQESIKKFINQMVQKNGKLKSRD